MKRLNTSDYAALQSWEEQMVDWAESLPYLYTLGFLGNSEHLGISWGRP